MVEKGNADNIGIFMCVRERLRTKKGKGSHKTSVLNGKNLSLLLFIDIMLVIVSVQAEICFCFLKET